MKILVISDTHNELDNIKNVFHKVKSDISMIIHLGDEISDIKPYESEIKILKVPGVYEDIYSKNIIPNRILTEIEGIKFLLTHSRILHINDLETDINPERAKEYGVNVVLYGHTHIPQIDEIDGIVYVNPGHLKTKDKKGYPPTYCILNTENKTLKVEIKDMSSNKIVNTAIFKFFKEKVLKSE